MAKFSPRLGGPTAEFFQLQGGGLRPLTPWPGSLPLDFAGGFAPRPPSPWVLLAPSVHHTVFDLATPLISTLRWAVLTVLWIGFCHTGPISLCVDLFVFICVYFVCFFVVLHSCIIVSVLGWTWSDLSLIPLDLSSFRDTVGWVNWPVKTVLDMTYNVFGGTLNLALSIYLSY